MASKAIKLILKRLGRFGLQVAIVIIGLSGGCLVADVVGPRHEHEPDWHAIVQVDLDHDAEVLAAFIAAQGE